MNNNNSRKRNNNKKRNPRRANIMNSTRLQTVGNSGGFRVAKRVTSSSALGLVPVSGFSSSLVNSTCVGVYFTQAGFNIYNPTAGAATSIALSYTGNSNYTQMFDQYRIMRVRLRGYFSNNYSSNTTTTSTIPLFYTAVDFDGANATIGSVQNVLSYQNCKVTQAGATGAPCIDVELVPRVVNSLTSNLLSGNNYGLMPAGSWIDCVSNGTPHWGVFIGFDTQGGTSSLTMGYLTLVAEMEYEYRGDRA